MTTRRAEHLEGPGLWVEAKHPDPGFAGRAALFLDRDGVIIADTGYPSDPGDVIMLDAAAPLIRNANRRGAAVIVVTNQSGIGRGYFGWQDFAAVSAHIDAKLAEREARIDYLLACAFHRQALPPCDIDDHPMRKPNPGMILRGAALSGADLSRSVIVGDRPSDMEAGQRAGLKCGWLVGANPAQTYKAFPIRRLGAGDLDLLG